ncbi:hypothetical protein RHMOL_Rhmol10G0260900 [Rhododendron molle]|uniref:Uncharacterized protein n=1 Tax=Rhododendron molle TaxID=49168 RepID=A0ACC0M7F1_RHOML|nr:hypothetical protein RHMOL_Rhmol10G0260900 [Rhododendron molle]
MRRKSGLKKMAILRIKLTILMIVGIVALASSESIVTFIFGDSLTEVGNNNYMQYSLAKSNFPYYGIDYPGGQPTGRFTNGRTIGDIISAKLGIPSPPAYLSLAPNADAILEGVNYASGGAGILNDTGLYFIQRLSFDDQIKNFEKTREAIKMKLGGDQAAEKFCNEAMYFIGIETPSTGSKKDGIPRAWSLGLYSFPKGEIKEWAVPEARFKVSNTSCCNVDTSVGGLCLPNSKLCKNRADYVFWDAFHPSDAANAILAEKFFSTLFPTSNSSAPAPAPSH